MCTVLSLELNFLKVVPLTHSDHYSLCPSLGSFLWVSERIPLLQLHLNWLGIWTLQETAEVNRPFSEAAQNRLGTSGITHTATNLAKSLLRSAKLTFPDCLFFKNYFIFFFSLCSLIQLSIWGWGDNNLWPRLHFNLNTRKNAQQYANGSQRLVFIINQLTGFATCQPTVFRWSAETHLESCRNG